MNEEEEQPLINFIDKGGIAGYLNRNYKDKTIGKEITPHVRSGLQILGDSYQDTMWKARRGMLGPHSFVGAHAIDTIGKIIPDIPLDKAISHGLHNWGGIDKPLADVGGVGGEMLLTRKALKSIPKNLVSTTVTPYTKGLNPVSKKKLINITEEAFSSENSLFKNKRIPKYSSGAVVQTEGGTLYRPTPGTMTSTFFSINDYDEADDFYNVIEDDDYLLSRFEGYDNPDDIRSEITTFMQNRERIDRSRIQSHELLQSYQRRGFQIPKQHKGKVRDVAGWIFTPQLEEIARQNDLDIVDVYSYLKTQDVEMYRFKEAVKVLNDLARPSYQDKVEFKIEQLEKKGTFAPGTLAEYRKLLLKIKNKKISFWSRGHKESLSAIFARGLSGGDRASNIYLQPFLDEYIRNPSGTITKLKNNAGLKDQEDLPLYALVKLADASWNLEEDFLRHANIFSKMIKREGVIDQEYHEIGEFLFRKLTKEGLEEWDMPDVSATIDKAKYPDKVALYKEAMVDAIVAYIEEFEDLQRRGIPGTDGLPLSSANLYQWFYQGINSMTDGVKHRLANVLEAALRKALSDRGLKMDEEGNIK